MTTTPPPGSALSAAEQALDARPFHRPTRACGPSPGGSAVSYVRPARG
ncbi:hypothetical protein [Streptomyces boluensis]|uniref:Uncharacterized protein n=1 Tax=Streptomyces boluensis TaxID=1775135 RepID=A0A964UMF4_9ACTN|nr:hypothetical protein [Streptomyces boluensis]NBE51799.1 hypothetical protein [Streptomyces boluensis]